MPKRKRTPEEITRKAKVRELMQELDINDMSDINALFKEFVGDILENGLEAELDDELGYSKYDYRNKDTDNSQNGHSSKTMKTSFGEVGVYVVQKLFTHSKSVVNIAGFLDRLLNSCYIVTNARSRNVALLVRCLKILAIRTWNTRLH